MPSFKPYVRRPWDTYADYKRKSEDRTFLIAEARKTDAELRYQREVHMAKYMQGPDQPPAPRPVHTLRLVEAKPDPRTRVLSAEESAVLRAEREARAKQIVLAALDDAKDGLALYKMVGKLIDLGFDLAITQSIAGKIAAGSAALDDLVLALLNFPGQAPIGPPTPQGWVLDGVINPQFVRGPGNGWTAGGFPGRYAEFGLDGQVVPEYSGPEAVPAGDTSLGWGHFYPAFMADPPFDKYQHQIVWQRGQRLRAAPLDNPSPLALAVPANLARFVNLTPQPVDLAALAPPETVAVPQQAWVIQSSPKGLGPPPGPPPTMLAHRSAPPRAGDKDKKARAGKFAALLFNALDVISEYSEIVDAFYQALPDDVRARWDRPEREGDQKGQYGIAGADWKLQALYYNWHRVDAGEAAKNVVVNQLLDQVYGAAFGARDNLARGKYINGKRYGGPRRRKRRR